MSRVEAHKTLKALVAEGGEMGPIQARKTLNALFWVSYGSLTKEQALLGLQASLTLSKHPELDLRAFLDRCASILREHGQAARGGTIGYLAAEAIGEYTYELGISEVSKVLGCLEALSEVYYKKPRKKEGLQRALERAWSFR